MEPTGLLTHVMVVEEAFSLGVASAAAVASREAVEALTVVVAEAVEASMEAVEASREAVEVEIAASEVEEVDMENKIHGGVSPDALMRP